MTPKTISEAATCYACIPDKLAALLYLFANIAGVTDPQTISNGAACYQCIPDKQAALLYLAAAILAGGGGGTTQVFSGNYGGGQPTDTPTATSALAIDTSNQTLWQWFNSAWH